MPDMEIRIWEFLKEKMNCYGSKTALVCGNESVSYCELVRLVEEKRESARGFAVIDEENVLAQAVSVLAHLYRGDIVIPLHRAYGENYCERIRGEIKKYRAEDLPEDIALIMFTSGSTANPKGVMLTHRNIVSNIRAIDDYFKVGASDKILIARPLMHSAVLTGELFVSLYKGMEIHLFSESFMPSRVAGYIKSCKISVFGCTPTMLRLLVPLIKERPPAHLIVSGEVLASEVAASAAAALPFTKIYSVYGLTEASPRVAALEPEIFRKKPGSIGRAIQNVEMRIGNGTENEGRLYIRSPGIMRGYLGNEALTRQKIKDGWLDTGDVAKLDDEGYYYILGRADHMIIRGGVNIYPEEMEALLKRDPRVVGALFYAKEHKILGKIMCVELAGKLTKSEAFALCRRTLPTYAQPQRIDVSDNLLSTPSGKIKRK